MNALMFLWVVSVFYLSPGRNVLCSLLLQQVVWLTSWRYFKRISAPHPILQACSCFSNNRNSKTDSGVASQHLQFITSIVVRADKSCGLHISQFTLACVATKLRLLYRPLEAVIIMYNQGSRLDDPNCELWDFGTSTIEAVLWEQHK